MNLESLCARHPPVSLSSTATVRGAVAIIRDLLDAMAHDPIHVADKPGVPPAEHPGYISRNEP